ncbi:MAG: ribonuclease HII [Synergistaceae bacterium]|nr:ribonuclease HII [Synergistaceae bacterium]MBQ6666109.1 ribonuclease HII [Synergistaceae bacterium]
MTRQIFLTDDLILPPRCEHDEAIYFLRKLRERGIVIGTDEAGRGALAGPVVASAVYLTQEQEEKLCEMGLRDSKRVTPMRREKLFEAMKDMNVIYRASMVSAEDVDAENVLNASLRAMRESVLKVAKLTGGVECVVVDGDERINSLDIPQWVLVKADDLIPCVSAASIVAKVLRDRLMMILAKRYPNYGLETNKGYPTPHHMEAVKRQGLSRIHRETFCRKILSNGKEENFNAVNQR